MVLCLKLMALWFSKEIQEIYKAIISEYLK